MALFPPRRRPPLRALIAIVVSCLFAVQGSSYAASPHVAGWADDEIRSGLAAYPYFEHCSKDMGRDGDSAPLRRDHSHCWAHCCQGGGREDAVVFFAVWSVAASLVSPPANDSSDVGPPPPNDRLTRPSSGWASSWSSRAPPVFI
ncbi:MAG: hypothetical protein C3F11_09790 [Methylocystaceae bacterium]|nr:MAG: hypothetical protein C3F11_09790 [Methylocystaceae bacterium]